MSEGNAVFTVTELQSDLWQIHEEGAGQSVDCYLIVGTERAALIDSLMSRGDRRLYGIVREKTDLPLNVLHTHGHGDHVGGELQEFFDEGCQVWLAPEDRSILGSFGAVYPPEQFLPLEDGQKFPLGGCTLETVLLPGHTPGSAVFLDRENGRLFSGDSLGSGHFWMQLSHSTSLAVLLEGVKRLEEKLAGMPRVLLYPGHRDQSPVQLDGTYVTDLHRLLEGILRGEIAGEPVPFMGPGKAEHTLAAGLGTVLNMLYDGDRLR